LLEYGRYGFVFRLFYHFIRRAMRHLLFGLPGKTFYRKTYGETPAITKPRGAGACCRPAATRD
jgi:hypothetical protein